MNRTLILLLAVLLLGGIAYLASTGKTGGPAPTDDRDFAYPEVGDIHRIFIADRNGHEATLLRAEEGWRYRAEDGRNFPANENVMKNLLQAVRGLEVQSLPARKAIPNMIRNLATGGILVQLFDRSGVKLRGYYIGGGANGERGTLAIMEGSENPYIVHLPVWTGNVRHRFNLQEDEWRSKVLFDVDPDRVESLSIEYPKQRNRSFRLLRRGAGYLLEPFYQTGQPQKEIARGVGEGILSRYENYYVSRYENRDTASINAARDRLPFAIIRLKEPNRPVRVVEIFPRFHDPAFANDTKTGETLTFEGLAAYTAFLNDRQDWALLAKETTQPLLVGYDSF